MKKYRKIMTLVLAVVLCTAVVFALGGCGKTLYQNPLTGEMTEEQVTTPRP